MRWIAGLVLASMLAGCVSGSDPSNGAIRFLNAVADAPRMDLLIDGELRIAGVGYAGGSAFTVDAAGTYQVTIEEVLPTSATAVNDTIYAQPIAWGVNEEISLIVVGDAASNAEEVVEIRARTRGVPIGQTRVQFIHATAGGPAVDVYLTEPSGLPGASSPLVSALGYKAFTEQQEVAGGGARIVLTAVNDPSTVLFDSGAFFLTLEGSLLIAVVANAGTAGSSSPFSLVVMTGTGSVTLPDVNTGAEVRLVNAAPASYSLDAFINLISADDTVRQACDPLSEEPGTLLEFCATAFTSLSGFEFVPSGSYDVKVQKAGADAVAAQVLPGTFATGTQVNLVLTSLTDDAATATTQSLLALSGARRIANYAQLRIADASLAADATVAGDPSSDRLEIYITEPGADIANEDPDFVNVVLGSETGYLPLVAGGYQLVLARADTATPEVPPEVLYSRELLLADGGLYTLVIADSIGAVLPLQTLSLEDDPTPSAP